MELVFVRHGESEGNAQGRLQGRQDSPLSPLGREQAGMAGAWLKQHGPTFDHVYCSPLSRASETARIIVGALGLPSPEEVPALHEVDPGRLQGLGLPEIKEQFPSFMARGLEGLGDFSEYGGEGYDDVQARVERLRQRFLDKHQSAGERICVVAHGGINFQFVKHLVCSPVPRVAILRMGNCTATLVRLRERRGQVMGEVAWHVPVELMGSASVEQMSGVFS